MARIWHSVIFVFLPIILLSHSPITFASTFRHTETIMINDCSDIASDGINLILLCEGWPKDTVTVSDLSGNQIESFDTPGAFTSGITYNGSRNRIIFSGGNNYDGLLYEMNASNGAISGPLGYAGYIQPYLAYDGSNILASGAAYGSNGVLTIPITKFDANSYTNHGSVSVTVDTGTQASGVSRSTITWNKGNLYTALGIAGLNRVYEFDANLNLLGEIFISQVGPSQGIGGITFIKDDLFVFNSSTDELYRYTLNPTPDLTGGWMPLNQSCRRTKSGIKCKITGTFKIQNVGNQDAISSHVYFYVSTANYYAPGETLLKSLSAGNIKVGKSKAVRLNYEFPVAEDATGKFIMAVIEIHDQVTEVDKINNIIVFGPIQ